MITQAACLSDEDLLTRVRGLIRQGNETTSELLLHLAEVEDRKLYAAAACSSLFTWCVTELGLSEDAVYKRITAARAARRFPVLLERLAAGRLHLTGICLLTPHLDEANHLELVFAAEGKSKRQIEQLIADRSPKPSTPDRIRKLPVPAHPHSHSQNPPIGAGEAQPDLFTEGRGKIEEGKKERNNGPAPHPTQEPGAPAPLAPGRVATTSLPRDGQRIQAPPPPPPRPSEAPGRVEPLGAERYKVQFTADKAWVDKLKEATALLSFRLPDGDMAQVLDQALTVLCEKLMKERFAVPPTPGPLFSTRRDSPAKDKAVSPPAVSPPAVSPPAVSPPAVSPPAVVPVAAPPEPSTLKKEESRALPATASPESEPEAPATLPGEEDCAGWKPSLTNAPRYIPAEVRRQVFQRDGLRCTFVDADGRRCEETRFLELHHCLPWALGGLNTADNLTLRCRCHNGYAARHDFGMCVFEPRHGQAPGPS